MILNRTDNPINREGRNKLNENWETLERTYKKVVDDSSEAKTTAFEAKEIAQGIDGKAAEALDTANQANAKSDNAVSVATQKGNIAIDIANQANNTSNYVQNQLDTVILESGDSNPEVIQARADFVNLRERLDTEKAQFTTQLAQRNEESYILSAKDKGPNEADYTNALQRAIDTYTSVFVPSTLGEIEIGEINVTKPLKISSNGATIKALASNVFNLSDAAVNLFDMRGFTFKTPSAGAQEVYAINSADVKINNIFLEKNEFNHLIVKLLLDDATSTSTIISRNRWYADGLTYNSSDRGYLQIVKNNSIPGVYYDLAAIIEQNIFDVYTVSGTNIDLCKIGGATQETIVSQNHFINKNLASDAQIDTFLGGHKLKFINNNLRNVSYIRKEEQGGTTAVFRYSYDTIDNNNFEVDSNSVISNILNVRGSLFKVTNNNIICRNANRYLTAINISAGADIYDEFNTNESRYAIISGNLIDMRSDSADGTVQMYPLQTSDIQGSHILNNVMLGGNTLAVRGEVTFANNSWRPNTDVDILGINSSRLSGLINNPTAIIRDNRIDGYDALAALLRANETTPFISHNSPIENVTTRHNRNVDSSSNSSANSSNSKTVASANTANNSPHSIAGGYATSGGPSTANRKWHIYSQTGNIEIAGTLTSSHIFADYAEYFPNKAEVEIPLGTLVTLDGDGVNVANGDDIIGVVSATAGVALGDTPFHWQGRYLRSEFGEILYDEVVNKENELIKIPRENPDYNPNAKQIPRSQRKDEWTLVGMIGQVYVRVDNTVDVGDFLTSRNGIGFKSDVKTSVRVLKKTGDNVAYCFIK